MRSQSADKTQYDVVPPWAAMTALTRRGMLLISVATFSWGIAFHSSLSAVAKLASVVGRDVRRRSRRASLLHMCSIGLRSGLLDGHGIDLIPRRSFSSWTLRAR